jgi:uncharacterized protein (DUF1697 family)
VPRHAAFLRGVNLGRHRRVTSDQLRSCFEAIGFDDVATFRSSGNVAFDAGRASRANLTARIEQGLAESLGFDVVVFLRTAAEVRATADRQPFDPDLVGASDGKLQVALLLEKPAKGAQAEVLSLATEEDRLAFGDRELYWLPSGGLLESALDLDAIEKLIGPTTRRTMGTIEQMAAKHFAG